MRNICLLTDSYKMTHWLQYPKKTERVYSYFESRVGARFSETVFFGLQSILSEYLKGQVVTEEKVREAADLAEMHFGRPGLFNKEGWMHIVNVHNGRLPVHIKAVPEGTVVPTDNVLMTIENTDPACWWLTNYLESLLTHVWYPCTVATQSREMLRIIEKYLEHTGTPGTGHMRMHDFGFRGVTCPEQAAIGGLAHLTSFTGTDNLQALVLGQNCYEHHCAGTSIPASEHSTMTSWGREGEAEAYLNMLEIYPNTTFACVSDSWDILHACKSIWGDELKAKVLASGGVVIRPDSGDPKLFLPKILEILEDRFGSTTNEKGYRVLHSKVRVIQGDGVDLESLDLILHKLWTQGWSADNLYFGSGGGLLQKLNRDTQRFAFKCSSINIDGKEHSVYKSPISDQTKASKQGRLELYRTPHGLVTGKAGQGNDVLETVFLNGRVTRWDSLNDIRERITSCK